MHEHSDSLDGFSEVIKSHRVIGLFFLINKIFIKTIDFNSLSQLISSPSRSKNAEEQHGETEIVPVLSGAVFLKCLEHIRTSDR